MTEEDEYWHRRYLARCLTAQDDAARSGGEIEALEVENAAATTLITECRDALAEELASWDLNPPLQHVLAAHNNCEAWLAAMKETK